MKASLANTLDDRPTGTRHRVLLVDDDSDVLVSVGGFLEAEGIDVVRVGSGPEALDLVRTGDQVDALVTDFAMPGMTGVALIAEARRMRPRLPAIIITGYAGVEEIAALPSDVAVLRKPFRRKEFVLATNHLLHRHVI